MFTKEQINNLLEINKGSDNNRGDDYFHNNSLKLRILEAKVLVDRWGTVSTDIIVHSSHKDLFKKTFNISDSLLKENEVSKEDINKLQEFLGDGHKISQSLKALLSHFNKTVDSVWGANIHYSDDCPSDQGIILSLLEDGKLATEIENPKEAGRSVAVFPVK